MDQKTLPESLPAPVVEPSERVVARIESGDIGLIGMMLEAAEQWREKEYSDCKLCVRNAPGVCFELFLVKKEQEGKS